jgi:transposase
VETVHRDPQAKGFAPLPKRWVVERVYGTLMLHRRLVRDYERRPDSAASMVYWSMTALMTRRLTGIATTTWRPAAQPGLAA